MHKLFDLDVISNEQSICGIVTLKQLQAVQNACTAAGIVLGWTSPGATVAFLCDFWHCDTTSDLLTYLLIWCILFSLSVCSVFFKLNIDLIFIVCSCNCVCGK